MVNWWTYCLSLVSVVGLTILIFSQSDRLSNETFTHLDAHERRKMSSDYVSLGKAKGISTPTGMRLLEKAARINPQNEQAWLNLSYPYLYAGLYEAWHDNMEKAIALNPETWQSLRGLQKLYYFRDYGGALYDLDATDTLTVGKTDYAENQSVHYLRGLCYLGLENNDLAASFLNKYIEEESQKSGTAEIDPTAYIYLAIIDNKYQNYTKAIEDIRQALSVRRPLADAYYHGAYAHFMLGQIDTAKHYITIAKQSYENGDFHKAPRGEYYEVPYALYDSDYDALEKEIDCFIEE